MKSTMFLLAAALLTATAASAQTAPGSRTMPNTSNPEAVPSGTAPVSPDPKGNVQPGEVFTKGAPDGQQTRGKNMMKRRKMDGDKMKKKMDTTM